MHLPAGETFLLARDLAGRDHEDADKEDYHDVIPYMMVGAVVIAVVVLYNLFRRWARARATRANTSIEGHQRIGQRGSEDSTYSRPSAEQAARIHRQSKSKPIANLSAKEIDEIAPKRRYADSDGRNGMDLPKFPSLDCPIRPPCPAVLAPKKQDEHKVSLGKEWVEDIEDPTRISAAVRGELPDLLFDCSICLEFFQPEDVVRETPCGHVFHARCLEWWLGKYRARCPLDQMELKGRSKRQTTMTEEKQCSRRGLPLC
ncbi:hypothetical protein A1O7_09715 [Cladophialophora yegresii CBS 114405]|uniref:RING-type domain-containing protein n=1 Tax=Cladophialophora yegresii CBS 114405 TaxID=1182544 RepID=W9VQI4_9EURO|nr:uncharacterized protein A1O7_09715 [Cladophialophora yegresii CBS 114405]EXJ54376.1 hypothetical protein A1O7_09715 [Cladophialophora yegresii CBS 114405]